MHYQLKVHLLPIKTHPVRTQVVKCVATLRQTLLLFLTSSLFARIAQPSERRSPDDGVLCEPAVPITQNGQTALDLPGTEEVKAMLRRAARQEGGRSEGVAPRHQKSPPSGASIGGFGFC